MASGIPCLLECLIHETNRLHGLQQVLEKQQSHSHDISCI